MKSLRDYIAETKIEPCALVASDKKTRQLLETIRRYGAVGNNRAMGYTNEDEGAGQLVAKTLALEPTGPTSGVIDEGMGDVDQVIQDIINGTLDAYDIMTRPGTPEEKYVSQILDNMYDTAATDNGLHPDDDFEEILEIVVERLADEYGHDKELSESSKDLYRVLELANINKGT